MTLGDINITSEMNTSNRLSTETEKEEVTDVTEVTEKTNEWYYLQPKPKSKVQFTLTQVDKQSMTLTKIQTKTALKYYRSRFHGTQ